MPATLDAAALCKMAERGQIKGGVLDGPLAFDNIVSEDAAKKYFGNTAALGKTMLLRTDDQFVPYTVTGVAKRCPQNSSIQFDVLLPQKISAEMEHGTQSWMSFFLNTYILLDRNTDIKTVEKKMTKVFEDDAPELIKRMEEESHMKFNGSYMLQPFTDLHLNSNMDRYDISAQVAWYILIYFQESLSSFY
jgi:putative ABC transport system permease protein